MPTPLRRSLLTLHVITSVGLLGTVASFALLASLAVISADTAIVSSAYVAMQIITVWLIVPLAWSTLIVGVVQSMTTHWGLWRHWWVVLKLLLTSIAIVVLLLQLDGIAQLARAATTGKPPLTELAGVRFSVVLHSSGGLLFLLVPVVLSVFKPQGLTRYGWAKRQLSQSSPPVQPRSTGSRKL